MVGKKIVYIWVLSLLIYLPNAFSEVVESTESESTPPPKSQGERLRDRFNSFTKDISDSINSRKSDDDEKVIQKNGEKNKNKPSEKLTDKTEAPPKAPQNEAPVEKAIEQTSNSNTKSDESETPDEARTVVRTRTSRELRANDSVSVGFNWNLISMWIPNKMGANLQYNYSENKTIAMEYQSAGYKAAVFNFKFGEIKESKYGVLLKSFGSSNSFYLSYGLMKYQLKAELGSDLFGPAGLPFAPLFDVSSMGFQFGLGNQWNWDNGFTLGIEWFSIYYHAFAKSKNTEVFKYLNVSDRDQANKVVDLIYNLPIFELLKIQLNYSF